MVVRPLPVLFACQGCPEYGDMAHEVASVLDARGFAESSWLGGDARAEEQLASKARSRFPVYAVEGCAKRCAGQWLSRHGVKAQRQFILAAPGDTAERIAERIIEGW
jgi:uncharacterized metal-binding protein